MVKDLYHLLMSASDVVGMNADPQDGMMGVLNGRGGHRQGGAAIGVDAVQVGPEPQLGGTALIGG